MRKYLLFFLFIGVTACHPNYYIITPVPTDWPREGAPVIINGELIETVEIFDQSIEPQIMLITSQNFKQGKIDLVTSKGKVKKIKSSFGHRYKMEQVSPGNQVAMYATIKNRYGTTETLSYVFTIMGRITPYVIYFNKDSLLVYEKYHQAIEAHLKGLEDKYGIKQVLLVYGKNKYAFAGAPDFGIFDYQDDDVITVGGGYFLPDTIAAGLGVATHEFGHKKYNRESEARKKKYEALYAKTLELNIEDTFIDAQFLSMVHFENMDYINYNSQVYSSAFMIQEMGFVGSYRKKWFDSFTAEQKKLATNIFIFVGQ